MIRSRSQQIDEGERPIQIFCALENKNVLNKTIKKVCNEKNKIKLDQKEILSAIHWYYSNLFKHRDAELKKVNIDDPFKNQNVQKLTENQRRSIEGQVTITKIGNALKTVKNEKTPGLDSFSAEFFKFC